MMQNRFKRMFFYRAGFFLALLLLNLVSLQSIAQLPLITDNSGTLGKGVFQIELSNGLGYENEHRCVEHSREISTVMTAGLNDHVDLVLSCPFLFVASGMDSIVNEQAGFSDMGIELKYCFLHRDILSMAVKPGLSFPTGNYRKGMGSGRIGGSLFLISSFSFSKVSASANLGYLRNENLHNEANNIWHISLDADWNLSPDFHLVVNSGLESSPDQEDQTPPAFALAGFYFLLNQNFEFSAGYKCGLTNTEPDHAFIYGLTARF